LSNLIPAAKRGGGKRRVDMRAVVNGVMHVLSTGCRWRYLPKEFPSRSTVNRYFCPCNWDGTAIVCITPFTSNAARRRNEKPAPPLHH
jgi:transposase